MLYSIKFKHFTGLLYLDWLSVNSQLLVLVHPQMTPEMMVQFHHHGCVLQLLDTAKKHVNTRLTLTL